MPITNGYCTLAEFKAAINPSATPSTNTTDDSFIEELITRASRMIDSATGRQFFASTSITKYFDTPDGNSLYLDADDLLAITTLTNGDATTIAATAYKLYPLNTPFKWEIRLLPTSGITWELDANGNAEGAISIAGSWGYVDRAATDAASYRIIQDSKQACLDLALFLYRRRAGQSAEGIAEITAAGVVITPAEMPATTARFVQTYRKLTPGA